MECKECGKHCPPDNRGRKRIYCSRACAGRSTGKNGLRRFKDAKRTHVCAECECVFENYYDNRKFCSKSCFGKFYSKNSHLKKRRYAPGRADMNQKDIVSALKKCGASVLICSDVGGGMPDLVVGYRGKNYLVEVKNPENWYGKRGLNPLQKEWAESWRGGSVNIIRSVDEAIQFLQSIPASEP